MGKTELGERREVKEFTKNVAYHIHTNLIHCREMRGGEREVISKEQLTLGRGIYTNLNSEFLIM